ncbi:MAG: DUF4230 domain-containing protein [Bacilli bacterium]|nr:DUF4230 domain-containing protein [Bacilli bacterium]
MKKKINLSIILISILILTGCSNDKLSDLEKNLSNIELTGDLVVQKVYYHNVAEYTKEKDDGILHIFDTDRELWVEYTGTVELGIDLTKVKIETKGNKIEVFIPKTKILTPSIEQKGSDSFKIYDSKDGLLNSNNLTMTDSTKAVKEAQEEMLDTVKKDTQLLRTAQLRSKNLIEERISIFSEIDESEYVINWTYEEN